MRHTNEHRRARKRGTPLPERPPEKNRLYDEVFGVVEKVEVLSETSIPVRIAQKYGYVTRGQVAVVLGIPHNHFTNYMNRDWNATPNPVGRLQVDDLQVKGNGAYLYNRAEMLAWVRDHPQLSKLLPQELR